MSFNAMKCHFFVTILLLENTSNKIVTKINGYERNNKTTQKDNDIGRRIIVSRHLHERET